MLVVVLVGASLWFGPRASAACHAFTVGATASVNEGGKATVVVERDGDVADSSVLVSTVDGTAKSPTDYTPISQRVTFTGTQTQKTVSVQTREDDVTEPTEAFQVKLSDGEGCTPGSTYTYGNPASVTIKDDDPVATATPSPTPTSQPTATPSPTPTATPTPSPTPTTSASPSATPSETPLFTPIRAVEDDGFPWLPVLAVVGFLAAGGAALLLARMRRNRF